MEIQRKQAGRVKNLTKEEAVLKAKKYCAYQERSQQEVRDKLYSWGMHRRDVEEIISLLIQEQFLKEERFAIAFAGGKFRIKKWGRIKIRQALKEKKVSDPLISIALKEISEKDYLRTLSQIIDARKKRLGGEVDFKTAKSIANYAISRGFEPELVWGLLRDVEGC